MTAKPTQQSAGQDARLYGRRDARRYAKQIRVRGSGAAHWLACRTIPGDVELGESSGRDGGFPYDEWRSARLRRCQAAKRHR